MKTFISSLILFMIFSAGIRSTAQDYTFDDFVGTWNGNISSESFQGYDDPITLIIESDGYYTETSGHLMPTLYPETQECEYDAPTNRFHWWYLSTVYSGQYFYQHFYYEIVYFSNDTLEMHYNYWDDPEPFPQVGTIFLIKENMTPAPSALNFIFENNDVILSWEQPAVKSGAMAYLLGYNVYHKLQSGSFELIDYVENNGFTHQNVTAAGLHTYQVTAVYDEGESDPSNAIEVDFLTPPPTSLDGYLFSDGVFLSWTEPIPGDFPMAGLIGFNVYYKEEGGYFEFLEFVQYASYVHYSLPAGLHSYYVTALFDGGESVSSNEFQIVVTISGIEDQFSDGITLYPNPASEMIHIESDQKITSLQVIDQLGQVLANERIASKSYNYRVASLNPGLYFLMLERTDGTIVTERVFIQ